MSNAGGIVLSDFRGWICSDLHPFCQIRPLIEQRLSRSVDDVQCIEIGIEVKEEPDEGEWKRYTPTGERWCNVRFSDGDGARFEWVDTGQVQLSADKEKVNAS